MIYLLSIFLVFAPADAEREEMPGLKYRRKGNDLVIESVVDRRYAAKISLTEILNEDGSRDWTTAIEIFPFKPDGRLDVENSKIFLVSRLNSLMVVNVGFLAIRGEEKEIEDAFQRKLSLVSGAPLPKTQTSVIEGLFTWKKFDGAEYLFKEKNSDRLWRWREEKKKEDRPRRPLKGGLA